MFSSSAAVLKRAILTPSRMHASIVSPRMPSNTPRLFVRNQSNNQHNQHTQQQHSNNNSNNNNNRHHQQRSQRAEEQKQRNQALGLRVGALVVLTLGMSYAFVPLYQAFCQATGFGGTVQVGKTTEEMLASADSKPKKTVTVYFNSDVSPHLPWKFVPSQRSIQCETGDTVLAFFRATNTTDEPIVGISTYNVTPLKAGLFFHKIQCFCFDEQRLRANETVEMPVFFYIDPDIVTDKNTRDVDNIVLSYTFFLVDKESGEPEQLFEENNQPV